MIYKVEMAQCYSEEDANRWINMIDARRKRHTHELPELEWEIKWLAKGLYGVYNVIDDEVLI